MSQETMRDLQLNTLIGFTSKRGNAWHHSREIQEGEGLEPNHYEYEVPVADVLRRLFHWKALDADLTATRITEDGVTSIPVTTHKAIVRSDTGAIVGINGAGRANHDYDDWLITNVATLLDADLKIGSAGVLKGGRQAWAQIEMPETMEAGGPGAEPVKFRPFLTAATSHDSSLATTYLTGAQVVVCDNTLSAALGNPDQQVKIRHSSRSLSKIHDVRAALGIVFDTGEQFAAQVARLTSEYVSDETWNEFVAALTHPGPNPTQRSMTMAQNKVSEIVRLWNYDERVAPWKNSAYGVLAAVNTHTHHFQTVKGATRPERNMDRVISGGIDKLDRSTLELLAKVS